MCPRCGTFVDDTARIRGHMCHSTYFAAALHSGLGGPEQVAQVAVADEVNPLPDHVVLGSGRSKSP